MTYRSIVDGIASDACEVLGDVRREANIAADLPNDADVVCRVSADQDA